MMSPGKANSRSSRRCERNDTTLPGRITLPFRTMVSRMPRSNCPEHTRTKAMRSRCAGSMLAWILKTTPVNLPSCGETSRWIAARGLGAGASSASASSTSCTPKLLMAEPKKTGVCFPARKAAWSKSGEAPSNQLDLALRLCQLRAESLDDGGIGDIGDDLVAFVVQAIGAGAKDAHAPVAQVVDAVKALAHAHRPREGHGRHAERALDLVHEVQGISHLAVHLVDEGEDGRVPRAADLQQAKRLRLHAVGRVDHHERRVHGGEHAVGVLGKVLVAGRVEEIHHAVTVLDLHDGARHRDAALLLDLHPVAGGVPRGLSRLHAAGDLDGAREEQELLGERGLAGVGVRDDREGAAACRLPGRSSFGKRFGRAAAAGRHFRTSKRTLPFACEFGAHSETTLQTKGSVPFIGRWGGGAWLRGRGRRGRRRGVARRRGAPRCARRWKAPGRCPPRRCRPRA